MNTDTTLPLIICSFYDIAIKDFSTNSQQIVGT